MKQTNQPTKQFKDLLKDYNTALYQEKQIQRALTSLTGMCWKLLETYDSVESVELVDYLGHMENNAVKILIKEYFVLRSEKSKIENAHIQEEDTNVQDNS